MVCCTNILIVICSPTWQTRHTVPAVIGHFKTAFVIGGSLFIQLCRGTTVINGTKSHILYTTSGESHIKNKTKNSWRQWTVYKVWFSLGGEKNPTEVSWSKTLRVDQVKGLCFFVPLGFLFSLVFIFFFFKSTSMQQNERYVFFLISQIISVRIRCLHYPLCNSTTDTQLWDWGTS